MHCPFLYAYVYGTICKKRRKGKESAVFTVMKGLNFQLILLMRLILFSCLFLFFGGCKIKQGTTTGKCETLGTVRNFEGLDGCGFLIELANGDLLNPMDLPEGFQLKDKQVIRFNYKIRNDIMTICMSEKASVNITCIEEVTGGMPETTSCVDTSNPFAVGWMDRAIDRHNPVQVIKYRFEDRWAYFFQAIPVSFLYDCEGNFLCETKGDKNDECHKKIPEYLRPWQNHLAG